MGLAWAPMGREAGGVEGGGPGLITCHSLSFFFIFFAECNSTVHPSKKEKKYGVEVNSTGFYSSSKT